MGWLLVSFVTFLALMVAAVASSFFAMVLANGYMGGTDPMVTAYVLCQGAGILLSSLLSGLGAKALSKATKLPLWLAGLIAIGAAVALHFVISFFSFTFAIAFFAPG